MFFSKNGPKAFLHKLIFMLVLRVFFLFLVAEYKKYFKMKYDIGK